MEIIMDRVFLVDIIRGIAFIFMIIHHAFYFTDIALSYITEYRYNELIEIIGLLSRSTFIILAGIMVYWQRSNGWASFRRRLSRSFIILLHASIITIASLMLFPESPIYFGILHFLGIATIITYLVCKPSILLLVVFIISIFVSKKFNIFNNIFNGKKMMDYFSLTGWMPLILFGALLGSFEYYPIDITISINFLNNNIYPILLFISKNSLELYTFHVLLFMIIAKIVRFIKSK